jgi:hypothetical protein
MDGVGTMDCDNTDVTTAKRMSLNQRMVEQHTPHGDK